MINYLLIEACLIDLSGEKKKEKDGSYMAILAI